MLDVLGQDGLEVATSEDQHPVEAFSADRADEALGNGVGSRCPNRGLDDPDALRNKHNVEGRGELGVSVTDEESPVSKVARDAPCLLGHPLSDRIGRDAGDPHEPRVVVDEEGHVETTEQRGVDREEITGDDVLCLGW
ncbi:MAG TPA: hypothetical protein VIX84_23880 [Acidimicrobiales bacterium]